MVIGARNNGASKMTRNISQREPVHIVPLDWIVTWFITAIQRLDEDAAYAVNEKDAIKLMIADAMRIDEPWVERKYMEIINQYEGFGIDSEVIMKILNRGVEKLERRLDNAGVRCGPRYSFDWYHGSRNLYIYEGM